MNKLINEIYLFICVRQQESMNECYKILKTQKFILKIIMYMAFHKPSIMFSYYLVDSTTVWNTAVVVLE